MRKEYGYFDLARMIRDNNQWPAHRNLSKLRLVEAACYPGVNADDKVYEPIDGIHDDLPKP